ncbi:acyltransferase family protein [Tundrisphaera lichenicola]|uniref:acyltransferase family protein n=1 Tax=Tundrisphaera lichenicola TaxID=2029860 RepID=UPI003EB7C9E1
MTQEPAASIDSPEPKPAPSNRLMSLDALRGFDMFWIVGAEGLVQGLRKVSDHPAIQTISHQLEHVEWEGFHFEDLIFPMFVFIVGVSLVFSTSRTLEREGRRAAVGHIVRRALLLYLFGVFSYGGFGTPFERIRLLGVLQRIAICYLCASLIFCFFRTRGRVLWCVGLLVGYWAVMSFVPVPGGSAGNFAEGQNLANWVDKNFLPLRKWDGDHDPEGLLSTIPAIANCLIGVFVGVMLGDPRNSKGRQVLYLIGAGLALAALGWAWSFQFPVIKKLWTSSFVLVACGYSALLLALFHLVIEVWGWRGWAQPFVWIGMNSITIYMLAELVNIEGIARRFVGGDLNKYFGPYGPLAIAIVAMLIVFAFARFLYQRKIFLRL